MGPIRCLAPGACLALFLLAGCAGPGGGADVASIGPVPSAPRGFFDADTCSIEGLLVDDEHVPVAGAQVGLVQGEPFVGALSDGDGRFAFSFLLPRTYVVGAAKTGYEASQTTVECAANANAHALLQLVRVPEPGLAFLAVYTENGRIGCSFGAPATGGTSTEDVCGKNGLSPQARSVIEVRPAHGQVTTAVYEMDWLPSGLFGGRFLSLDYPLPITTGVDYATDDDLYAVASIVRGAPNLNLTVATRDPADPLHWVEEPTRLRFEVRGASSTLDEVLSRPPLEDGSSRLVMEQPFTLHIGYFYHGALVPAGFTMLDNG